MKNHELAVIERELSVRLPEWYCARLLNYPFEKDEMELFSDATELIRQNRYNRNKGWFGFPWLDSFLIIGEDGCGNLYFVNLGCSDDRIYIADHDGGPEPKLALLEQMISSDSIESHINEFFVVRKLVDERRLARINRKWWKFWA